MQLGLGLLTQRSLASSKQLSIELSILFLLPRHIGKQNAQVIHQSVEIRDFDNLLWLLAHQ